MLVKEVEMQNIKGCEYYDTGPSIDLLAWQDNKKYRGRISLRKYIYQNMHVNIRPAGVSATNAMLW